MKIFNLSFACFLTLWAYSGNLAAEVTIFSNGTIYTVAKHPTAEAFAVENDVFVGVGKLADLQNKYKNAKYIDLKETTVVPGLIDAHGHLLMLGDSLMQVDLVDTQNKAEIITLLKDFAADLPEGQWLLGRGWDQNDWPVQELPTAKDLDKAFPNRPVWLNRVDGHAVWANSAAMALAKQDLSGDWQPEGGTIMRNADGQPSGVFIDKAEELVLEAIPKPTPEQLRFSLERAMQQTASEGITSIHDAGTSIDIWRILESLKAEDKLKVRLYLMADGDKAMLDHLCESGPIIDQQAWLTAQAVKLYSDGALGSRGAALLENYDDDNHAGLLMETPEKLARLAKRAAECGLQVNIHAIGDNGNRVSLDAIQAAKHKDNPGRHRIEHAQVVAPSDFARFKKLGVIASVQPTHATSDMYWAEDRVGKQRIKGAYAWQTFIENEIPLALGSDFPVERSNPLLGFYAAITRQDSKGWPQEGWYPEQRLNREQALYGFTLGAAHAAFQEDMLGSIETGKKADFVILSKDIMTIPKTEILETKVKATYIDGKAIYQAQ